MREVIATGRLTLRDSLDTSRDYVSVDDATDCIMEIATTGRHRIYNVGTGRPVSNRELAERFRELTGCEVERLPGGASLCRPQLSVDRVRQEFGFRGSDILADLPALLDAYQASS